MNNKLIQIVILAFGLIALSGCSVSDAERIAAEQAYIRGRMNPTAAGIEVYTWEEPMVDVVEVPAGLDPQGIYYRPQHEQIVEIRQGRWRYSGEK